MIDDDPSNLVGKHLNAYFYKNGEYSRILKQFAPTVFHNEFDGFSEADVTYWKEKAEKYYTDYVSKKVDHSNTTMNGGSAETVAQTF